ncbi:MAG TPA: hypothetical protein ENI27_06700 [bacterium]|nr:hypothetical protein [bacterium]
MREIKYRQWMGDYFNYWGFGVPEGAVFSGPASLSGRPASDFPQEELTGLKDKNGTEIYEGDILSFRIFRLRIVWDSEAAAYWVRIVGEQDNRASLAKYLEGDPCVVVGNIHENPEFLK